MPNTVTSWIITPLEQTPQPVVHPRSKHPWEAFHHTAPGGPPNTETIVLDRPTGTGNVLTLCFAEGPDTRDDRNAFNPFDAAKTIYGPAVLSTQKEGTNNFRDTAPDAFKIAADALNAREAAENQAGLQILALLAKHAQ